MAIRTIGWQRELHAITVLRENYAIRKIVQTCARTLSTELCPDIRHGSPVAQPIRTTPIQHQANQTHIFDSRMDLESRPSGPRPIENGTIAQPFNAPVLHCPRLLTKVTMPIDHEQHRDGAQRRLQAPGGHSNRYVSSTLHFTLLARTTNDSRRYETIEHGPNE